MSAQFFGVLGDILPSEMPVRDRNGGSAFKITRYTGPNSGFGFAGKVDDVVKPLGTLYSDGNGNLNYINEITGKTTQLSTQ